MGEHWKGKDSCVWHKSGPGKDPCAESNRWKCSFEFKICRGCWLPALDVQEMQYCGIKGTSWSNSVDLDQTGPAEAV